MFINKERFFKWYSEHESLVFDEDAVLESVETQYGNSGMTNFIERFSDGHSATYIFDVVHRYIIDGEIVCTVDSDGVHGDIPDDWDNLETEYIF